MSNAQNSIQIFEDDIFLLFLVLHHWKVIFGNPQWISKNKPTVMHLMLKIFSVYIVILFEYLSAENII